MIFRVDIHDVQHISNLSLELDLEEHKLTCLVRRNGVGKTTLIRALRNLTQSDTFLHTAQRGIFSDSSRISYWVDEERVTYEFDEHLDSLNCKQNIPPYFRGICTAELSIPYGSRFNYFQSISRVDQHIRRQIVLRQYRKPQELIGFLSEICSTDKFRDLIETRIGGRSYFSILLENGRYIREDYFSSGEYFLIDLYRTLTGPAKLIAVDEIDISLDAAAQVQLLEKLREFCSKYQCNVLFTTHSLAMMRMLKEEELFFMEWQKGTTTLNSVPYSFVKSLLFGFRGWDRYILTEDRVLRDFLESFIRRCCPNVFFEYKIIYVGGGQQVVDLLSRNRAEQFLANPESVIAVLDGDQNTGKFHSNGDVYYLPFSNVEDEINRLYECKTFPNKWRLKKGYNGPKNLFNTLQRDRIMSGELINEYIYDKRRESLRSLGDVLSQFLTHGVSGVQ